MPPPVPADALRGFFTRGRPSEKRAVGAEFELLLVDRREGKEAALGGPRGVEEVLRRLLAGGRGWRAVQGDGHLIALDRGDGASITLEPGSQLEFSTPPRPDALRVDADLRDFLRELRPIAAALDLAITGVGLNPFRSTQEVELGPKKRYRIMTDYLSRRGDLALDMMRRTCSVHVTFDYRDETDAIEMQRVAFGVTPLVVALFAHSPLERGSPNAFKSFRWEVWHRTDSDRCGVLPGAFDADFSFARYRDRLLELPLIFTWKDGVYRAAHGLRAGRWFSGDWSGLEGHDGLAPAVDDLEWVINQSFRDVRLRRYLECRAADFPSPALATAPVALWTGVLYDLRARGDAWELVAGIDMEERAALSRRVAKDGLAGSVRGRDVGSMARDLVAIARDGLVRRGLGEERLLESLVEQASSGRTPAESLLDRLGTFPADPSRIVEAIELP